MGWTIPNEALDAADSAPTESAAVDLDQVMSRHASQWNVALGSGSDAAGVSLRGSIDGANWYTLVSTAINGVNGTTQTVLSQVIDRPARYVRARVDSITGTATITAHVTSHE